MIIVAGPTASGKTELSVALAQAIGGEVVSADSRQVYRGLDAGTAKPRRDAQGRVEGVFYHLIDCADVPETFDAGRFSALARPLCEEIRERGRTPIVAGGTGLYIRALLEGLSEMPGRDEAVRARLEKQALELGRGFLHQTLSRLDPVAAGKIPANNIQRVIRALEIHELTGRPISSFWSREPGVTRADGAVVLAIEWPTPLLNERIAARAGAMWPNILREVRELVPSRYAGTEPGFQSLGYRQALLCLRGELSENEGLRGLVRETKAYAKRQRTWLRHQLAARSIAGGATADMLAQARSLLSP